MNEAIARLQQAMAAQGYITDRATATAAYLAMTLHKPLLVEGPPGVGKTEIAKVLAGVLDTQLVRLQGELNRVTEARRRLRRVVPAYAGATTVPESRLNTAA